MALSEDVFWLALCRGRHTTEPLAPCPYGDALNSSPVKLPDRFRPLGGARAIPPVPLPYKTLKAMHNLQQHVWPSSSARLCLYVESLSDSDNGDFSTPRQSRVGDTIPPAEQLSQVCWARRPLMHALCTRTTQAAGLFSAWQRACSFPVRKNATKQTHMFICASCGVACAPYVTTRALLTSTRYTTRP